MVNGNGLNHIKTILGDTVYANQVDYDMRLIFKENDSLISIFYENDTIGEHGIYNMEYRIVLDTILLNENYGPLDFIFTYFNGQDFGVYQFELVKDILLYLELINSNFVVEIYRKVD